MDNSNSMNILRELNAKKNRLVNVLADIEQEMYEIIEGIELPNVLNALNILKRNGIPIYLVSSPCFVCCGSAGQTFTHIISTVKTLNDLSSNLIINSKALIVHLSTSSFDNRILKLRYSEQFRVSEIEFQMLAPKYKQFIRF